MADRSLTVANSVLMLSVAGLYDSPQQLQGYAADNVFDSDAVNPAETQMGVDGKFSAGWIPVATPVGVTLQADSASNDLFENWEAAQNQTRSVFFANMLVVLPATGRKYTCTKGVLTQIPKLPTGQKTLQPRKYQITFESVQPAAA